MTPRDNDASAFFRKTSLRRSASRYSLALSRRTTFNGLRQRLRRTRTRAASFFRREEPTSPLIEYFTTRLPSELRVEIYCHLLRFSKPLKPFALVHRPPRLVHCNLAILRASRLVYAEALPVFYNENTFCIARKTFCTNTPRVADARPPQRATLNHDLVRSLHVTDLSPSSACAALSTKHSWDDPPELPCVFCNADFLPLMRVLRSMPKLREATIEYSGHEAKVRTFSKTLAGPYGRAAQLDLECVGVGKYRVTGHWFARTSITLQDTVLSETWNRLLSLSFLPRNGLMMRARQATSGLKMTYSAFLNRGFDRRHINRVSQNMITLIMLHDRGFVPLKIANVWPVNAEMEFRGCEGLEDGVFLHALNVELQRICREGIRREFMVRRRRREAVW